MRLRWIAFIGVVTGICIASWALRTIDVEPVPISTINFDTPGVDDDRSRRHAPLNMHAFASAQLWNPSIPAAIEPRRDASVANKAAERREAREQEKRRRALCDRFQLIAIVSNHNGPHAVLYDTQEDMLHILANGQQLEQLTVRVTRTDGGTVEFIDGSFTAELMLDPDKTETGAS